MQEANLLGLQEMKNAPGGGTEDLNDQAMAMGAKMGGFDWLGIFDKSAGILSGLGKLLGRAKHPGAAWEASTAFSPSIRSAATLP
jgi:hypothetical protein